ncbi:hypothetical protein CN307_33575 [Bacillus cereus]|uniref:Uncharacterized protein n=1 Tax=Bacillus cereus TaxID=1396 RepID=A0A2A8ZPM9_BACCE|nr:hypothetical protein CN307_33575 [Bacillus cereus]
MLGWFSKRGKGERLGTSLNELWPSPIYIIDEILSFILANLKRAPLKSALLGKSEMLKSKLGFFTSR